MCGVSFMNLLAVDQVTTVRTRAGKAFCTLCGAVGLATSAVLVINFTGSGMRQLARNLDIIPKYPYVSTASAGDEAAMKWLQSNTPQDAVFATNRIHSMANASDGISSLYTAMSGRQAYMEGYTYAVTNMGGFRGRCCAKAGCEYCTVRCIDGAGGSPATLCGKRHRLPCLFQTVSGRHKPAIRACGRV